MVGGGWWLVVVGGWWLVGSGWLVVGWWLVVGGGWLVVGWWLVVGGGWLVVGGGDARAYQVLRLLRKSQWHSGGGPGAPRLQPLGEHQAPCLPNHTGGCC